jgi:3-oxoacyl-[acyl-carrier-protein] synthase-1
MSGATYRMPVYLNALGMINALGADLEHIAAALARADTSGVASVALAPGMAPVLLGAVRTALDQAPPPALAHFDCRNNRLLLAAARQIAAPLEAAKQRYGAHRIGVVLGTSTSGIAAAESLLARAAQGQASAPGYHYAQVEIGTAAPFLAQALGVSGAAYTISTACTSSAKALAAARRLLRLGVCDAVVAGGADSLCQLTVLGFAALESASARLSNPMSRNRDGINLGEGAALFLMTREPGPAALLGVGESSDAHHVSAPDPQGVGGELALRAALADAQVAPARIGYVNLHATATRKNDQMEAQVMSRVFAPGVPTSGTKPCTGHTLGAAGATELGLCWLTLARGSALPRHVWDGQADAQLAPLELVEQVQMLQPGRYCMSNSFAFGGSNVSLIIGT